MNRTYIYLPKRGGCSQTNYIHTWTLWSLPTGTSQAIRATYLTSLPDISTFRRAETLDVKYLPTSTMEITVFTESDQNQSGIGRFNKWRGGIPQPVCFNVDRRVVWYQNRLQYDISELSVTVSRAWTRSDHKAMDTKFCQQHSTIYIHMTVTCLDNLWTTVLSQVIC